MTADHDDPIASLQRNWRSRVPRDSGIALGTKRGLIFERTYETNMSLFRFTTFFTSIVTSLTSTALLFRTTIWRRHSARLFAQWRSRRLVHRTRSLLLSERKLTRNEGTTFRSCYYYTKYDDDEEEEYGLIHVHCTYSYITGICMYTEYYDFSNQINYNQVTRDEREKPWHAAAAAGIMPARLPEKLHFWRFSSVS